VGTTEAIISVQEMKMRNHNNGKKKNGKGK
jgi:hypothetical protein